MSVLALERVVVRYRRAAAEGPVEALRARSLSVDRGEVLAVLGPNGSGKSTLLETLAFLRRPDEGRVSLDGRDAWGGEGGLAARRRCPALLQKTVLFSASVARNVAFGPRALGLGDREVERRVREALAQVGLAGFEERRHHELSGGEVCRVALARVLALEPDLMVLDEPTAALDGESAERIEELIRRWNRERGTTVVLASHSVRRAVGLATRVATAMEGRLVDRNLDNRSFGTLSRVEGGWAYIDHGGWRHVFSPESLVEDPWMRLGPLQGPVRLGVPSTGVRLSRPGQQGSSSLLGEVDAVRRDGSHVRVRVRLPPQQRVRARLRLADLEQLGIGLGDPVALDFAPRTVHVFAGS